MIEGNLRKMAVSLAEPVRYQLCLDEERLELNPYLGQRIHLQHTGEIFCVACGRKTKKSFSQGYCYPCTQKLAQCDICIVRPEKCHFAAGTCREPDWAQQHCFIPHYVYLANSSGLKVGITRGSQIPTRWIDQGATQALPIFRASSRFKVGMLEELLKKQVADKTDWRKMLKGDALALDLPACRDRIFEQSGMEIDALLAQFPGEIEPLRAEAVTTITYPVNEYPHKVSSLDFDKTAEVSGVLQGIKGQYLMLDTGVINLRKFGGYRLRFGTE
ncbi:MAG: DUF2797 domain-containing protein [Gammaproteobacteria bacterium]|nr:DUF2797 domain-containing protein [Gammaproteobacteria bacterium]